MPVAKKGMKMNDEFFFLRREGATFNVRPQVIDPPEPAAFTASLQTGITSNVTPTALAVGNHVVHQLLIFFW
ncbi:hypothetical protein Hanom_Chr13g01241021 [Helianthus anomalus]